MMNMIAILLVAGPAQSELGIRNAHRLCVYLEELDAKITSLSQSEKDERAHSLMSLSAASTP